MANNNGGTVTLSDYPLIANDRRTKARIIVNECRTGGGYDVTHNVKSLIDNSRSQRIASVKAATVEVANAIAARWHADALANGFVDDPGRDRKGRYGAGRSSDVNSMPRRDVRGHAIRNSSAVRVAPRVVPTAPTFVQFPGDAQAHTPTEHEFWETVNGWLGWGDPDGGLWFIGIEEGATFTAQRVAAMRGKSYEPVSQEENRNYPIAITTSKIVCGLTGFGPPAFYRQSRIWWRGSKVFNGNLLPLGKPSMTSWPESYEARGLTALEYASRYETLKSVRQARFRELRQVRRPQAIVCFGKSCWSDFEDVFVTNRAAGVPVDHGNMMLYESDRVILTPHFSRGSLMPNIRIDALVRILQTWNVRLPR